MSDSIQGISGSAVRSEMTRFSMNAEQKTSVQEIISNYDPEHFSKDEFMAMGREFRDAGIRPSEELKSMLEEHGFQVDPFVMEGHGPKPPEGPAGLKQGPPPRNLLEGLQQLLTISEDIRDDELKTMVEELMEKQESDEVTAEDMDDLHSYLRENVPLVSLYVETEA